MNKISSRDYKGACASGGGSTGNNAGGESQSSWECAASNRFSSIREQYSFDDAQLA